MISRLIAYRYRARRIHLFRFARKLRAMQKQGNYALPLKQFDRLLDAPLNLASAPLAYPLEGVTDSDWRTIIRQRLIIIAQTDVLRLFLEGKPDKGPHLGMGIGVPPEWRRWLIAEGYPVAAWRSRYIWKRRQIAWWWASFRNAFSRRPRQKLPDVPYVYLHNMSAFSIPADRTRPGETILRWLRAIGHGDDTLAVKFTGQPPSATPPGIITVDGPFCAETYCFNDKVRDVSILLRLLLRWVRGGGWWLPFIANDILDGDTMARMPQRRLACRYVFTNSDYMLRPLWTYVARHRGAELDYYVYSTNIRFFEEHQDREVPSYPSYRLLNWPRYHVLRSSCAGYIERTAQCGDVTEWPTMALVDRPELSANVPKRSILVFDISPASQMRMGLQGYPPNYYSVDHCVRFLEDILAVAEERGLFVAMKMKRDLPRKMVRARYARFIAEIRDKPNVVILDSEVAAIRYARDAGVAVSMPFTSAAVMAANIGVPSAFYDPAETLKAPHRGEDPYTDLASGLPLLAGRNALGAWIDAALKVWDGSRHRA